MARKRGLMLVVVTGLVALTAAACEILTPLPPARPVGTVFSVDIVGDSLIRQTTPELDTRMTFWGYPVHTAVGFPSKGLDSPEIINALNSARSKPHDIVVEATGTNDAVTQAGRVAIVGQDAAEEESRQTIRTLLHSFADRCVVIVTAKENVNPIYRPDQAVRWNAVLREEAMQHLNTIVVDWAADPITQDPTAFYADLTHFGPDPNIAGTLPAANAYANAITRGVQACQARLQPPTQPS